MCAQQKVQEVHSHTLLVLPQRSKFVVSNQQFNFARVEMLLTKGNCKEQVV
jgi:hypothetical protein